MKASFLCRTDPPRGAELACERSADEEAPADLSPSGRDLHAAAVWKDHLFVNGGWRGEALGDTWSFNLLQRKWRKCKSNGPPPRYRHASATMMHKWITYGGRNATLKVVGEPWEFCFASERWRRIETKMVLDDERLQPPKVNLEIHGDETPTNETPGPAASLVRCNDLGRPLHLEFPLCDHVAIGLEEKCIVLFMGGSDGSEDRNACVLAIKCSSIRKEFDRLNQIPLDSVKTAWGRFFRRFRYPFVDTVLQFL